MRLKKICISILTLAAKFVPIKHNLWVFGAWSGKQYSDNPKYMFEYINRYHREIQAVWLTGDGSIVDKVRSLGYSCYDFRSIRGMMYASRAEVAFETAGEEDVSPLLNIHKTKVVQLWHGMGTKAMQWKTDDGNLVMNNEKNRERFLNYYWIATSELYIDAFSSLLEIPPSHFEITGYPRNDMFISKPQSNFMESMLRKHEGKKFAIYMPTHRNFGEHGNSIINVEEFRKLNAKLVEENIMLIYKPHFSEFKWFQEYENDFSNILLAKEPELWGDVYSYLHYFDILISDYSSVITDFMCSGKPVILFAYDLEEYKSKDAGLMPYFWTLQGGPLCYTWEDVIKQMISIFENDEWKEEREKCRMAYHKYNDGNNSKRVYEYVMKTLGR